MHREGSTKIESVAGSINVFWKASAMGMESVVGSFHGIESVADSMFVPTQTHIPAWWVLSSSPSVWFIWFVVSSWQCFVHLWCSECQILGYPCNFSWIVPLDFIASTLAVSVIFSGDLLAVRFSFYLVLRFSLLLLSLGLSWYQYRKLRLWFCHTVGCLWLLFFCPGCPWRADIHPTTGVYRLSFRFFCWVFILLSRMPFQGTISTLCGLPTGDYFEIFDFFFLKQKRHTGNGGLIPFSCRNAWRIVRQVLWTPRGGSWIRFFTTAKNNICTTVMRIVNVSSPLSGDFFLRVFLRVYSNGLTIYVSVFRASSRTIRWRSKPAHRMWELAAWLNLAIK